jgi:hypothetical protein
MGDNLEVPPSSDRQGIHFNDLQGAETEQKMWFSLFTYNKNNYW